MNKIDITSLLNKIKKCHNYDSLYSLKDNFGRFGLALETTQQGRVILCRTENNMPIVENVFDDYLFLGTIDQWSEYVPDKLLECVLDFTKEHCTKPLESRASNWQDQACLYGSAVRLDSEAVDATMQSMALEEVASDEDVLEAIREFLKSI